MLESRDDIQIDYGTLSELRKKRNSGRRALSELSETLDRLTSEIEEKTAQLKQLNLDYRVAERSTKEHQNRIFYIREALSKIDDDAYRLQIEFEEKEDELKELRAKKQTLSDDIIHAEKGLLDASDMLSPLEKTQEELDRKLEEQNKEKRAISDDISSALSETNLEREEVEARMQELNTLFLAKMRERNEAGEATSEIETALKALGDHIAHLENEGDQLEKCQVLQAEQKELEPVIEKLRKEAGQLGIKCEEMQETLENKQEDYDALSAKSSQLQSEIESLEKEVAAYDEAIEKHDTAREERARASEMIEKFIEDIRTLFTQRRELRTALLLCDEKIKAIKELDLS